MDSVPPPLPPSLPENDIPPLDENALSLTRRVLWSLFVFMTVTPPAWVAGIIAVAVVTAATVGETHVYYVPIPIAIAVAVGVIWRGLVRGWYYDSKDFRVWGICGFAVLAMTILGVRAHAIVDASGKDKSVLSGVRQLAAAADQYYLENGVTTVSQSQLVGATNYMKALNVVSGETYPRYFTQGVTITVTGIGGARTITYAP